MTRPIITVDKISKAYQIGLHRKESPSFREAVMELIVGPLDRLRSLAAGGSGVAGGTEETFWALKNVSFEVEPGEVVGIIGGNGAGKSTLLKVLSRITEPTEGEIRLRGRVASLLEVGTGFHPDLTGLENIYLNGAILGMRSGEITSKLEQIIAFAEIEKFIDTPVKRYSSGMYVRLAFAVAAHLEPEILIVDEVLAVGDAEFQKKCLGRMQQISGEGRTVLFVSHNMGAISSLCSKCVVMDHGTPAFVGNLQEGITRYLKSNVVRGALDHPVSGNGFELIAVRMIGPNEGRAITYQPCAIEVEFKTEEKRDVAVHFMIVSSSGQLVIGVDSLDLVPNCRPGANETVCCRLDIESLPLIPGSYYLQLLLRNDSDYRSWAVPRSFEFDIEGISVYGQRRVESRWHGTTAVKAKVQFTSPSKQIADTLGKA